METNSAKILIVDDEKEMRDAIVRVLRKQNYELHTASNGKEALEKIREISPRIIILDLNMPVMSGIEFMKEFQTTEAAPNRVIVLSGHLASYSTDECLKLGAWCVLSKPFIPFELREHIRQCLENLEAS